MNEMPNELDLIIRLHYASPHNITQGFWQVQSLEDWPIKRNKYMNFCIHLCTENKLFFKDNFIYYIYI